MENVHRDLDSLPDLLVGVPASALGGDGRLLGRVGEEVVLLVRTTQGVSACQATCPHYGAPLIEGCVHNGRIHCPWHHASFDLSDGRVCRPPALDPLKTWRVEERHGKVRVLGEAPRRRLSATPPRKRGSVVVVGAGAAGIAAVVALREVGHSGALLVIDPDPAAPYDRPNLSKDYLAGTAPEEWLPLRSGEELDRLDIQRIVDSVTRIRPDEPVVELEGGQSVTFDGLILATGSDPSRLRVPGADQDHVLSLRSLDDCRAIRARAVGGTRVVIVGAGFLGLEVAASLRARDVEVAVVAPEAIPLGTLLGPDIGGELQTLHETHGVRFHLGAEVEEIGSENVRLSDGTCLPADMVVVGIGVQPRITRAVEAGLASDDGIIVDRFLRTSRDGVYAAGDIASFPDPWSGHRIRIEHWAVAQAQGRTAAFNLMGYWLPYRDVPFFWTSQYGVTLQWSGFPGPWDRVEIDGSLAEGSLAAHYTRAGWPHAAAFVGRDQEALRWALAREVEVSEAGW